MEKKDTRMDFVEPVNAPSAVITSLSDLQSYAKGTVVRFPDFADGQPLVARVRRPSLLALAKNGKIPNALLGSANELFSNGTQSKDGAELSPDVLTDMYKIMTIMAEATFIEPTYEQIVGAGLELTDEQLAVVFGYSQSGVNALDNFRKE